MPRADVLIENPLPGGSNKTNLNRARRYVKQGRAAFVGAGERVIRFGEYKQADVARSAEQKVHARVTGVHYDEVGEQFYERAHRLPIIEPIKMIEIRGDELAWSFSAAVRRMRRAHTAEEVAAMRKAMSR